MLRSRLAVKDASGASRTSPPAAAGRGRAAVVGRGLERRCGLDDRRVELVADGRVAVLGRRRLGQPGEDRLDRAERRCRPPRDRGSVQAEQPAGAEHLDRQDVRERVEGVVRARDGRRRRSWSGPPARGRAARCRASRRRRRARELAVAGGRRVAEERRPSPTRSPEDSRSVSCATRAARDGRAGDPTAGRRARAPGAAHRSASAIAIGWKLPLLTSRPSLDVDDRVVVRGVQLQLDGVARGVRNVRSAP